MAGRAGQVASVEYAIAYPNILIADIVFEAGFLGRGNALKLTVAVAAPHEPSGQFALPETIVTRGVRILAGEVHEDLCSFMERIRHSCLINVVAWKPYRISKYLWVASSSVIFALGPIEENMILWHDWPKMWEELPHGAAALEEPSRDVLEATHGYGAMYAFPHDDLEVRQHVEQLLSSTTQTIGDVYDLSRRWPLIDKVKQKVPQLNLPHTQKLSIGQKGKGTRSDAKLKERAAARYGRKPWAKTEVRYGRNPRSGAATQRRSEAME